MSNRLSLPKIYPITDLTLASARCHASLVAALARAGADLVQLREKHLTPRAFFLSAVRAVEEASRLGCRVIINDDVGLCLASGAHGVHLGDEDMPPHAARKVLGNDAILGVSSHSVEEAMRLSEGPCDYVAVGPVYATMTKPSGRTPLGPEGIARVRSAMDKPLVAIGGIGADNVQEVIEAGADSAAVISAIMTAEDPGAQFTKLHRLASLP